MRLSSAHRNNSSGFTLLELMIASVVMAIVFMGFISSMTGSFLATNMANKGSASEAAARDLLEEALELSYGDMLLLDGNSMVSPSGLAAKFQVFETTPGLLMVEVEVCRPKTALTVAQLAATTMAQFHQIDVVDGSRVQFCALSTGALARATGITQSGTLGGTGTGNNGVGGLLGGQVWW